MPAFVTRRLRQPALVSASWHYLSSTAAKDSKSLQSCSSGFWSSTQSMALDGTRRRDWGCPAWKLGRCKSPWQPSCCLPRSQLPEWLEVHWEMQTQWLEAQVERLEAQVERLELQVEVFAVPERCWMTRWRYPRTRSRCLSRTRCCFGHGLDRSSGEVIRSAAHGAGRDE